jgi:hypothetical protein
MSIHRIDIEPVSLGERGQRYRVTHNGVQLVDSSRNPEFDACRALLGKGITGRLEVWHKGWPQGDEFPAMRLDIEKGARLTVEEGDRIGPRFARWRPRAEEVVEKTVSSSDHGPRNGGNELSGGGPPPNGSAEIQPSRRQIPPPSPSLATDPVLGGP